MQVDDLKFESAATSSQMAAGGALLERIREFLSQLTIPLPERNEFLRIVAEAYDLYVAPVDIPGVPNIIEPWVDSALKAILLQQAAAIYDMLAKS